MGPERPDRRDRGGRQKGIAPLDRVFSILDARVRVAGPAPVVAPIAAAYARFVEADPDPGPCIDIEYVEGDAPGVRIDDRTMPVVAGIDPTLQFYQHFLKTLLENIRSYAILHGAALADLRGDGVLIAAPAGYGKSSVAMELACRGFRFLGDDYAPFEIGTGRVFPYPRAVSVVPGGTAPLPPAFRDVVEDENSPRIFGKTLVDVGAVLGEGALSAHPVPLRNVVFLTTAGTSWDHGNAPTRVNVAGLPDRAEQLDASFRSIAGVEIEQRYERPDLWYWRLRIDHAKQPTAALSGLLEDDSIVYLEKHWDARPEFETEPRVASIGRRRAAELLGRDLLNRRGTTGLLSAYAGKTTALFFELAGALARTDCHMVTVGRFEETVALIRSLCEQRPAEST